MDDFIPMSKPFFGNEEIEAVTEVIKSGWVRIRYHEREDSWTIQVSKLDRRTKSMIRKWQRTVSSKTRCPAYRIINLKEDVLVRKE